MIAVVLFAFASNSLTRRLVAGQMVASADPDQVVQSVQAIAPYTNRLEENLEQVRITLTGSSFVGSDVPGALPTEYSHTIAKGETLAAIAIAYGVHVSDILNTNGIKPEEAGAMKVGMVLRVPAQAGEQDLTWLNVANDARRRAEEEAARVRLAAAAARAPRTVLTRGGSVEVIGRQPRGGSVNGYPWGWCTWWVASKRSVPRQMGNAKSWLASARARGMATGSNPAVGAIVVTSENRFYGHVAYVEAVNGDSITISEMNYRGWGVVDRRTIPAHGGVVRGYIY